MFYCFNTTFIFTEKYTFNSRVTSTSTLQSRVNRIQISSVYQWRSLVPCVKCCMDCSFRIRIRFNRIIDGSDINILYLSESGIHAVSSPIASKLLGSTIRLSLSFISRLSFTRITYYPEHVTFRVKKTKKSETYTNPPKSD